MTRLQQNAAALLGTDTDVEIIDNYHWIQRCNIRARPFTALFIHYYIYLYLYNNKYDFSITDRRGQVKLSTPSSSSSSSSSAAAAFVY